MPATAFPSRPTIHTDEQHRRSDTTGSDRVDEGIIVLLPKTIRQGPDDRSSAGATTGSCWRVELAAEAGEHQLTDLQSASAVALGARLTRAGTRTAAMFSVTADTMTEATRVALGRWAHLSEVLALPPWPVVDFHVEQLDSQRSLTDIDLRRAATTPDAA